MGLWRLARAVGKRKKNEASISIHVLLWNTPQCQSLSSRRVVHTVLYRSRARASFRHSYHLHNLSPVSGTKARGSVPNLHRAQMLAEDPESAFGRLGRALAPERGDHIAANFLQAAWQAKMMMKWNERAKKRVEDQFYGSAAIKRTQAPTIPKTSAKGKWVGSTRSINLMNSDGLNLTKLKLMAGTTNVVATRETAEELAKQAQRKLEEMKRQGTLGTQDDDWALQGDEALNTSAAWQARLKLRKHILVIDTLIYCTDIIWEGPADLHERTLAFPEYEALQVRLYKALVKKFDMQDAKNCASEDWAEDSARCGGSAAGGMSRDGMKDSLFEMADVCTCCARCCF